MEQRNASTVQVRLMRGINGTRVVMGEQRELVGEPLELQGLHRRRIGVAEHHHPRPLGFVPVARQAPEQAVPEARFPARKTRIVIRDARA